MRAFWNCKENLNLVNFYVLSLAPKYEMQVKKKTLKQITQKKAQTKNPSKYVRKRIRRPSQKETKNSLEKNTIDVLRTEILRHRKILIFYSPEHIFYSPVIKRISFQLLLVSPICWKY